MRNLLLKISFILLCSLAFVACNDKADQESVPVVKETEERPPLFDINSFKRNAGNNDTGIVGIYDVPEMLSLCKLDSASMSDVSRKVVENFATLEKEMNAIGAIMDGPQGMIYYSNDPKNFKFETVLLIDKMPAKTPKNCQIVILEASYMLIYNYHGSYEGTFKSYDIIRNYISDHKLVQSGPAREFYPETAGTENDPSRLLTQIMVPVTKAK